MNALLVIILLLGLSALFSSAELAIMGVPLYKIKRYIKEHSDHAKKAELLLSLREKPERTLITILIGNNLVNVVISIYAAQLGDSILGTFALGGAVGFMLVSVSITFMILFFGEIIPKVFATRFALKFGMIVAPMIQFISIIPLLPFVWILEKMIKGLQRSLGAINETVSKEDVEIFMEEGKKQGIFSNIESMIIHNLLEFRERAVESIYTHRTETFAIPLTMTLEDAIEQIVINQFSRIPLYEEDKDNITKLLTLREALALSKEHKNLKKTMNEFVIPAVNKIPITASVFDVFLDMKKKGNHFAVVIDEYGGTAGIVTFEDVLEDLVGAIRDESDHREEAEIVRVNENTVKIKGDVILRDVIDILSIYSFKLPQELIDDNISEEDTVSYIILHHFKEFAKQNDTIEFGNLLIEVLKTNKSGEKIEKVKVTWLGNKPKIEKARKL